MHIRTYAVHFGCWTMRDYWFHWRMFDWELERWNEERFDQKWTRKLGLGMQWNLLIISFPFFYLFPVFELQGDVDAPGSASHVLLRVQPVLRLSSLWSSGSSSRQTPARDFWEIYQLTSGSTLFRYNLRNPNSNDPASGNAKDSLSSACLLFKRWDLYRIIHSSASTTL